MADETLSDMAGSLARGEWPVLLKGRKGKGEDTAWKESIESVDFLDWLAWRGETTDLCE